MNNQEDGDDEIPNNPPKDDPENIAAFFLIALNELKERETENTNKKKKKMFKETLKEEEYIQKVLKEINKSSVVDTNIEHIKRKILLNKSISIQSKTIFLSKFPKKSYTQTPFGTHEVSREPDSSKLTQWIYDFSRIPFGNYAKAPITKKSSKDRIKTFLTKSRQKLDDAVYGLDYVKDEIVDIISKTIRNPNGKGTVIALCGPPGVGKTKLVKVGISQALGRHFETINFGGMKDASLIYGHDFTYVGSKYGRICQTLINSGIMNPVFYMDEVDKIPENKIDEIYGMLTHLLDEEQNEQFYDNHFQGVQLDISKSIFVVSFNDINKIDTIVSDRMKIIHIEPPSLNEKVVICKKHLIPEILNDIGLKSCYILFSDEIIRYIISVYTLEEKGIRKCKKNLENICNRINTIELGHKKTDKIAISKTKSITFKFPLEVTKDIVDYIFSSFQRKENEAWRNMFQ